jgi:hypothetical protein
VLDIYQYWARAGVVSIGAGIAKGDVVIGFEVAVGFLIAWVVRKMGRVGQRVDTEVDQVLDAGLDRLHDVVAAKLGSDPALEKLQSEAGESGEVGPRTQARVRLALEEAAEQDPAFAAEFEAAVAQVQAAQRGDGGASAGDRGVAVTGGVHADHGGVAVGGVTGGSVSFGERQDPPRSVRP